MKLKLDENLGRRWAEELRAAGYDVDTVHGENLSGAADPDVLRAAMTERRVLVTIDLDFANPLRCPPETTLGIAVLRVRDRPGRQDLDAVVSQVITALAKADMSGGAVSDRVGKYQIGVAQGSGFPRLSTSVAASSILCTRVGSTIHGPY